MIMNKQHNWIVFDFDGTLVDSLNVMYLVYVKFMESKNLKPLKSEFLHLNGPTIKEIVVYLKEKYDLNETEFTLNQQYDELVNSVYLQNVTLFEGRKDLLNYLKKKHYKLGLVTSANQNLVFSFLDKNKIKIYFDEIVCGDEVNHSKPHPEIYSKFVSKIKNYNSILVLEDSKNGIQSANSAGLKCLNVVGKTSSDIMLMIDKN